VKQAEINAKLLALEEEEKFLRNANARVAGEPDDPLNLVRKGSAEMRAKRLAEIQQERATIGPAEDPVPHELVTAAVKLARSTASVQSVVSGQVLIRNDGSEHVEVAAVIPWCEPHGPSISNWTPPPPKGPKVPAGGELAISFSFVALRPTTYTTAPSTLRSRP
jgi:hypothetical protein